MAYDWVLKVVLFIMEDIGKDALERNFLTVLFKNDQRMSIGVDFYAKDVEIERYRIRLHLWILPIEEEYRFLTVWRNYMIGSDGIILIYDINNAKSLNWLSKWIQVIKSEIKYDIPILLVGNKLDLEENREVSQEQVDKFKGDYNISSSMEISLKTGENVEEMFRKLVRMDLKKGEETKELKIEKKYGKKKRKEKKKRRKLSRKII